MKRFIKDEAGQGMVEYGLIIALVAVVVIVGISMIGTSANSLFQGVSGNLSSGS